MSSALLVECAHDVQRKLHAQSLPEQLAAIFDSSAGAMCMGDLKLCVCVIADTSGGPRRWEAPMVAAWGIKRLTSPHKGVEALSVV